jgi:hypothetical protein
VGESWSDGGLWDDILWLAQLAWTAGNDDERRMRWHHLVMTVGNFERQGGRRLRPARISPPGDLASAGRPDQFRIPDALPIVCEDVASWRRLESSLHGAAAATTTTVLAALWPDRHHILDWRVLAAVAGLGVVAGGDSDLRLVASNRRDQLLPTVEQYSMVRPLLVRLADEAGLPLRTVERALYLMSRSVQGKGMTWAEYGEALAKAPLMHETAGSDGTSDDEQEVPPAAQ